MESRDLMTMLRKIILEETKFLRTYSGKVLNNIDDAKKGRILCSVLELGWDTQDKAAWCYPSDKNSIITPKIDDYVRIAFSGGNPNRPYYFGVMAEINEMIPSNYDKNPTTQILFQDNKDQFFIKYDEQAKTFTIQDGNNNKVTFDTTNIKIKGSLLNIFGATESFVKGTTFDSWMTTFIIALNAHVHTCAAPGAPSTTPTVAFTPPTNYLSTKIKGE